MDDKQTTAVALDGADDGNTAHFQRAKMLSSPTDANVLTTTASGRSDESRPGRSAFGPHVTSRLGGEFTAADVADAVDVSKRQVRRVLAEFVDAGYLTHVDGGDGTAKVYAPRGTPSAGEVDLPDARGAVAPGGGGRDASNEYYTWDVRVGAGSRGVTGDADAAPTRMPGAPPSPATADGIEPPG